MLSSEYISISCISWMNTCLNSNLPLLFTFVAFLATTTALLLNLCYVFRVSCLNTEAVSFKICAVTTYLSVTNLY